MYDQLAIARYRIVLMPIELLLASIYFGNQSPSPVFLAMSDTKDTKKKPTSFFKGFSTGPALRLWLFFLFSFYFLGYPVPLCILLGFAGGLGGGWIYGWWKSTEGPKEVDLEEEEQELELSEDKPLRETGLRRLAERRRDTRDRRRSQTPAISFGNFFSRR